MRCGNLQRAIGVHLQFINVDGYLVALGSPCLRKPLTSGRSGMVRQEFRGLSQGTSASAYRTSQSPS